MRRRGKGGGSVFCHEGEGRWVGQLARVDPTTGRKVKREKYCQTPQQWLRSDRLRCLGKPLQLRSVDHCSFGGAQKAGASSFTQLLSVTSFGGAPPTGLAFDQQGNLWVAVNGHVQQVQEFTPPFTSPGNPVTLTNGLSHPNDLAIWPIPQGLPLY
jgi:hypothetical protein